MTHPLRRLSLALALVAGIAAAPAARAATWSWSYTGAGISAGGSLDVSDTADASGFHEILGITGERNGVAITGLWPSGSAIPGNEPFALDNVIRLGSDGQITVHGFGYSLASGAYANPYWADFLAPPVYQEVYTVGTTFVSELPVVFSASPVPEPEAGGMIALGIGLVALLRRRLRG
ncbi:PEP-CTERM sorting domain-containing protein [Derxia gummosa]|uniref:PEP-CTERM sorting domain-containing protein n=1 Tax=Derxia gummosa DSM 723 TaxID=1121388 RepID=A0A8B6X8H1_9BURK|nr:PEP-CTERM sorting domain-containing protein [Derxia gummosa]